MDTIKQTETKTNKTINPATGKAIKEHSLLPETQALAAVRLMQEAFLKWREESVSARADKIAKLGKIIGKHKDELAELMTTEMGKTLDESKQETIPVLESTC